MNITITMFHRLAPLVRLAKLKRYVFAALVLITVTVLAFSSSGMTDNIEYPGLDYKIKPEYSFNWQRRPTILILSLLHNSEKRLPMFRALLQHFSYPHHLISVALGEDGSTDKTAAQAEMMLESLRGEFKRVQFFHFSELDGTFDKLDRTGESNPHAHLKHDEEFQHERRAHLAKARNLLLRKALKDEDWVFWLDSDVRKSPKDLIERMLETKKTIVAPNCVIKYKSLFSSKYFTYDANIWRETKASLEYQRREKPTYLFLEGYDQKRPLRLSLADLYNEGDLVEVDGVGACALLIKAYHHRKGLIFPEKIYKNHIESEGLAKMAQDMGVRLWAMPRLAVLHACNYESAHGPCAV